MPSLSGTRSFYTEFTKYNCDTIGTLDISRARRVTTRAVYLWLISITLCIPASANPDAFRVKYERTVMIQASALPWSLVANSASQTNVFSFAIQTSNEQSRLFVGRVTKNGVALTEMLNLASVVRAIELSKDGRKMVIVTSSHRSSATVGILLLDTRTLRRVGKIPEMLEPPAVSWGDARRFAVVERNSTTFQRVSESELRLFDSERSDGDFCRVLDEVSLPAGGSIDSVIVGGRNVLMYGGEPPLMYQIPKIGKLVKLPFAGQKLMPLGEFAMTNNGFCAALTSAPPVDMENGIPSLDSMVSAYQLKDNLAIRKLWQVNVGELGLDSPRLAIAEDETAFAIRTAANWQIFDCNHEEVSSHPTTVGCQECVSVVEGTKQSVFVCFVFVPAEGLNIQIYARK